MKKSILLAASAILTLSSCEASLKSENEIKTKSSSQVETTEESTKESDTTEAQTKETTTESNKESHIKIVSHSLSKDHSGNDILIIEYSYTNIEEKPTSFSFACQDKVFQNGVECNSTVICDDIDTQQQINDVQTGATYNLKVGYALQDMTNANVYITDLFGDETLVNKVIELGGGEGKSINTEKIEETSIKIIGHKLSKDYKDQDVLVVDYEFYNGNDKPESFIFAFSDKAFQNGVECDDSVFGCDDVDSQSQMSDIQPGVTIKVSVGYHIKDTSDVSIIVQDFITDKEYLSETVSLT